MNTLGSDFSINDTLTIDASLRLLPDNNNVVIEYCDNRDWNNGGESDGRSPQFDNSAVKGLTFD